MSSRSVSAIVLLALACAAVTFFFLCNYTNWSYRSGRFVPVSDHAREGLHLDKEAQCASVAHVARDW
jgi:hypothetical protein